MGSRCKKALVAESVRESLHSWCKRVKQKSKHDSVRSHTARSLCSLESMTEERDKMTTVSGTLTRSSSLESLNQITVTSVDQLNYEDSRKVDEYLSGSAHISSPPQPTYGEEKVETLLDLFLKTWTTIYVSKLKLKRV